MAGNIFNNRIDLECKSAVRHEVENKDDAEQNDQQNRYDYCEHCQESASLFNLYDLFFRLICSQDRCSGSSGSCRRRYCCTDSAGLG